MIVNELKKRSEIFIEKIVENNFIQGMITETLPAEAICHYLKADSVYLDKFADIYVQLFAKVPDKASKEFFLGQIDF